MPDIEVIIRKAEGVEGAAQTSQAQTGQKTANKKEKGKKPTEAELANAAILQVGKQLISQGINQYGDLTGNYYANEALNAITSIGADLVTIAVGGVAGAIYVAGKNVMQIVQSQAQQFRKIQEHEFTRERLGQISIKGSRY